MTIELEQILFRLHSRTSRWAAACFDVSARRFIEVVLLVLAVLSYTTFFYLHAEYIGHQHGRLLQPCSIASRDCLKLKIESALSAAGGLGEIHLFRIRIVTDQVAATDKLRRLFTQEAEKYYAWPSLLYNAEDATGLSVLDAGMLPEASACDSASDCTAVAWNATVAKAGIEEESETRSCSRKCGGGARRNHKRSAHMSILKALARHLLSKTRAAAGTGFMTDDARSAHLQDAASTLREVINSLQLLMAEEEALLREGRGDTDDRMTHDSQSRAVITAAKNLVFSIFSSDGFNSMYIPEPVVASFEVVRDSITQVISSLETVVTGPRTEAPDAQSCPTEGSSTSTPVTAVSARLITLYRSILQALVLRSSDLELRAEHSEHMQSKPVLSELGVPPPAAPGPRVWQVEAAVNRALTHLHTDRIMLVMMTSILASVEGSNHSAADVDVLHPLTSVPAVFKPSSEPSFLYSLDKGLLSLSAEKRDHLQVKLTQVDVDASEGCIGTPLSRWLLKHLVGFDTAIINSMILALGGRGFVYSEHSGELHSLGLATDVHRFSDDYGSLLLFKFGTFCSAVFLLFASSSLVSFILAQTQQRMIKFTVSLQHNVRARLPLLPLVASHLMDSLVFVPIMLGVLFFLFEFFSDQLLAFLVLLVVWLCELWSITSCRTVGTLRVFPRVFGMLLTWFHVYYLAYPFGFQYMALGSTSLALLCTLFHLWNRYELPALLDGVVTARNPRVAEVTAIMTAYLPDVAHRHAPAPFPTEAATNAPLANPSSPRENAYPPREDHFPLLPAETGLPPVIPALPSPRDAVNSTSVSQPPSQEQATRVDSDELPQSPQRPTLTVAEPKAEASPSTNTNASTTAVHTPPRPIRMDTPNRSPFVERLAPLLSMVNNILPSGISPTSAAGQTGGAATEARSETSAVESWTGGSASRASRRSAWT